MGDALSDGFEQKADYNCHYDGAVGFHCGSLDRLCAGFSWNEVPRVVVVGPLMPTVPIVFSSAHVYCLSGTRSRLCR